MKKLKGTILGDKTHDVGYRVFLLTKAMELGIGRFHASNTFNKEVQAVVFYFEADQTAINEYKDLINSNFPENAEVTEVSFEDYSGYVTSISDYMHLIQVEQLNKGISAILSIEKKQGQMLEKQDATIDIMKSVKEDTSALREDI
jgi:acylphosphatase